MEKIIFYILLGWLWSVLFRTGAKFNKIDPIYSIVITGAWLVIIGLLLMLYYDTKFTNVFGSFSEVMWVSMIALWSVVGTLVLIKAMQDNIPMSTFLPLYQVVSLLAVTVAGIFFFKEKLNMYQTIGILLSFVSIWLIMKK